MFNSSTARFFSPLSTYLNGVDDVVSVQAGPQLVDGGPVDVLQPAEQTSVQVEPVLLQTEQVVGLDEELQLIDDLVHLQRTGGFEKNNPSLKHGISLTWGRLVVCQLTRTSVFLAVHSHGISEVTRIY